MSNWHCYFIKIANPEINPPNDWVVILENLGNLVLDKIIDKIEAAAFVIRGSRRIRWLLDQTDPQYATESESIEVAKKLLSLYLDLVDFQVDIDDNIVSLLTPYKTGNPSRCPMCLDELSTESFLLDGRTDPNSISMGHITPLSMRGKHFSNHFADNVNWQHRRCNYMQGERTINEALDYMEEILQRHQRI